MPIELLVKGKKADIYAYLKENGESHVVDFIEHLNVSEQKKITRHLEFFAERGELRNREKFRVEEKPIYAFKSFQVRILCFFLPNAVKRSIVLTHGLKKQQDAMSRSELDKANRIYKEITEV